MLSVYTRHAQNCDHRDDINWRRCRCPKWIQGVGADGRGQIRITAKTRSWEQAEAKARQMDQAADPTKPQIAPAVTIAEAVSSFRAYENGRCLEKTTIAQSKTLFEVLLLNWAKQRGLVLPDRDEDVDVAEAVRADHPAGLDIRRKLRGVLRQRPVRHRRRHRRRRNANQKPRTQAAATNRPTHDDPLRQCP
jgi:hypothetical protein